jgi:hypothetical protein
MVEPAVDHEARRLATEAHSKAELAMVQIENSQKTINDALRRQELFETEVRANMQNIQDKMTSGLTHVGDQITTAVGRVHGRLDLLIRSALGGTLMLLVGLLVYVWKSSVGP